MGRAMLIIVAGVLVTVGIIQTGIWGTLRGMDRQGAQYAESIQAKNIAYAGTERVIQKIYENPDIAKDGYLETLSFSNGEAKVEAYEEPCSEEPCEITVRSTGKFNGEYQGISMTVRKGYSVEMSEYIEAAVGIDIEDFELELGENAEFIGEDKSGVCEDEEDLSVPDTEAACRNLNPLAGLLCSLLGLVEDLISTALGPGVGSIVESTLDLIPLVNIVHNLEDALGTEPLTGEIVGDLGSPEQPGVFMVEGGQDGVAGSVLNLVGGEGYGVMIIHQPDHAELETALLLAEDYTFHGLVIIDNVSDITTGNIRLPNINGSLLITNSDATIGIDKVEIEIPDNTVIQYDCGAWKYVEKAIGPQIINVYEQGRVAAWEAEV